jgi:hypothetical protein
MDDSAQVRKLEARIQELEEERAAMHATEPRDQGMPPDARVAELETELAQQRKERDEFGTQYWEMRSYVELRTEGVFTRAEFNKVRAILHPDLARDAEEQKRRTEAFKIFGRCEKLLKKEPLPEPPPMLTAMEDLMAARLRVRKENQERGRRAAATRARKKPGRQLPQDNAEAEGQ